MLVSLKADEIALDCHGEILYKSKIFFQQIQNWLLTIYLL